MQMHGARQGFSFFVLCWLRSKQRLSADGRSIDTSWTAIRDAHLDDHPARENRGVVIVTGIAWHVRDPCFLDVQNIFSRWDVCGNTNGHSGWRRGEKRSTGIARDDRDTGPQQNAAVRSEEIGHMDVHVFHLQRMTLATCKANFRRICQEKTTGVNAAWIDGGGRQ